MIKEPVGIPSELEFLEFFGTGPNEASPEDGYWSYEIISPDGMRLRLSFDILERSIQVALLHGGTAIATVSHEGLESIRILEHSDGALLKAIIGTADTKSTLELRVFPTLVVRWATMLTSS